MAMPSFNDRPCARAAMITMLVGVLTLGVAGCGNDNQSSSGSGEVDLKRIETLSAPAGFKERNTRPDLELAKSLAANPLPPGFVVHPSGCSPASAAITSEQLQNMATRVFDSDTSRIAVVAYDAGPDSPFDVPEGCRYFSMTGPDGAGAIFAPWTKLPKFSGADAVRATHSVIREQTRSASYDSYLYTAKVKGKYRILASIAAKPQTERPELQPRSGVEDVLQRAIAAIVKQPT